MDMGRCIQKSAWACPNFNFVRGNMFGHGLDFHIAHGGLSLYSRPPVLHKGIQTIMAYNTLPQLHADLFSRHASPLKVCVL